MAKHGDIFAPLSMQRNVLNVLSGSVACRIPVSGSTFGSLQRVVRDVTKNSLKFLFVMVGSTNLMDFQLSSEKAGVDVTNKT